MLVLTDLCIVGHGEHVLSGLFKAIVGRRYTRDPLPHSERSMSKETQSEKYG